MPEEKLAGGIEFTVDEALNNIRKLNREVRTIESTFKVAAAKLGDWGNSMEGIETRQASLTEKIAKQNEIIKNLNLKYDEAVAIGGRTSESAKDYERQLNNVTAAMIKNEKELAKLNEVSKHFELDKALARTDEQLKTTNARLTATKNSLDRAFSSDKLKQAQAQIQESIKGTTERLDLLKKKMSEMEKEGINDQNRKEYEELKRSIIEVEDATEALRFEMLELNNVNLDRTAEAFEKSGRAMSIASAAIVAGMGAASKAAIDWEDAFAGVRKTVEGTPEELQAVADGIRNMSKEIPVAAVDLAKIAENAGQLGIETKNVLSFTRTMADLGVTTNLAGEQAAQSFAKFANITGMAQGDFERLGSTIVDLGNNLATTEADISTMAMRLAAAGTQAGMSEAEILGLAAAMSSVGLEAEAGGTAFSKVLAKMQLAVETNSDQLEEFGKIAGMSAKEFAAAFKNNAADALTSFTQGLGDINRHGKSTVQLLDEMGLTEVRLSDALKRAASSEDLFRDSIQRANNAWTENAALSKEASVRYETTASQIEIMKNNLTDAAVTLGQDFLPIIKDLTAGVKDVAEWFSNLDEGTKGFIIKALALTATVGPLLLLIGKGVTTFAALKKAMDAATISQQAFNVAQSSSAIGLIATVAAVAVAGLWQLADSLSNAKSEAEQLTETLGSLNEKMAKNQQMTDMIGRYKTLKEELSQTGLSAEAVAAKQEELNTARQWIIDNSDGLVSAEGDVGGALDAQIIKLEELTASELELLKVKTQNALMDIERARPEMEEQQRKRLEDRARLEQELIANQEKQIELKRILNEIETLIASGQRNTEAGQARYNQLIQEGIDLAGRQYASGRTGITGLNASLNRMGKAAEDTDAAIEKLGEDIAETDGEINTLNQTIIRGAQLGIPDAIAAAEELGLSYKNLGDQLNDTTDDIEGNTDAGNENADSNQKQVKTLSQLSGELESAAKAYEDVSNAQEFATSTAADLIGQYSDLVAENGELLAQYPELYAALDENNTMQENSAEIAKAIWGIKKQMLIEELRQQKENIDSQILNLETLKINAVRNYEAMAKAAGLSWEVMAGANAASKIQDTEKAIADAKARSAAITKLISDLEKTTSPAIKKSSGSGGKSASSTKKETTKKVVDAAEEERKKRVDTYKKMVSDIDHLRDMDELSEKEAYEKKKAARNDYLDENSDEWKSATRDLYKWEKEERQRQHDEEKKALAARKKNGALTETEYIQELKRIRDEYFTENEEEWKKATEDIGDIQADILRVNAEKMYEDQERYLTQFVSDWEVELSALLSKYDALASQLQSFGGGLFDTDKEGGRSLRGVTDLEADIALIDRYGAALEALKDKKIPEDLLGEIVSMNTEDALWYAERLLKMTDEEYTKYIETWTRLQNRAASIADQFYQDELDALNEKFISKIPDAIDGLKEECRTLGADSGAGIAEGIRSQGENISSAMKSALEQALANAKAAMDINSPSKVTASQLGKPVVQGVAQGITDNMRYINNAMSQVTNALAAAQTPSVPQSSLSDIDKLNAINSMIQGATQPVGGVGPITLQLSVDGNTFANIILPYLGKSMTQKGIKDIREV